jgi:hypothetical protein
MSPPHSIKGDDRKHAIERIETTTNASSTQDDIVVLTPQDNTRIVRKIDRNILLILVWTYFLQILDKSTLGYAALFGLKEDANLHGCRFHIHPEELFF